MRPDRVPDDVSMARLCLAAVTEDGSPVGCPGHLEIPRHPTYSLHAEASPKRSRGQIGDEALERSEKRLLLSR